MTTTQHNTKVTKVRRGLDTIAYIALCDCGWESRYQGTATQAENEATDHVVAATRGEP